jgi:hypothetical protein
LLLLLAAASSCDKPDDGSCVTKAGEKEKTCPNLRIESVSPLRVPVDGGQIVVRGKGLLQEGVQVLLDGQPAPTKLGEEGLHVTIGPAANEMPGRTRIKVAIKHMGVKVNGEVEYPLCRNRKWGHVSVSQAVTNNLVWVGGISVSNQVPIIALSGVVQPFSLAGRMISQQPDLTLTVMKPDTTMIQVRPSVVSLVKLTDNQGDLVIGEATPNNQVLAAACIYQPFAVSPTCRLLKQYDASSVRVTAVAAGDYNQHRIAFASAGVDKNGGFIDVSFTDKQPARLPVDTDRQVKPAGLLEPAALHIARVFPASLPTEPSQIIAADLKTDNVHVFYETGATWTPVVIAAGPGPKTLSVGDVDGDGLQDIVVAHQNGVSALLQRKDRSFTVQPVPTPCTSPTGVALADLDGDTAPDLAVAGRDNQLCVSFNDCLGNFIEAQTLKLNASPRSLRAEDLDRDGKPDLLLGTSNGTSGSIQVLLNEAR